MKVALVVLSAQNNKLETLKPLMPQVLEHLKNIEVGNVVEVKGK